MQSILEMEHWITLVSKTFDAVFPVIWVLIGFAVFNRKSFKNQSILRFILWFVFISFTLRFVILFSGVRFAKRYYYTITVALIILSTPAIPFIRFLIKKVLEKRFPKITSKHISIAIILALCSICIAKIARPDFDKKWITHIGSEIKEMTPDKPPIIITNLDDKRVVYYASGQYLKFGIPGEKIFHSDRKHIINMVGSLSYCGKLEKAGSYVALTINQGLPFFKDNLNALGNESVYVLMLMDDSDFRQLFIDENVDFPLQLKKVYKDHKKRDICLYKLKNSNDEQMTSE
jgi:hypothetical protein